MVHRRFGAVKCDGIRHSGLNAEMIIKRGLLLVLTPVKPRIKRIEVLFIQSVLNDAEGFTETGELK